MVGRTVELGLFDTVLGTAVAERACHLALVLGPAGVGKSRLVQEFLATVEGQGTVLRGRCVEYGEGLTYRPIAEVIRQAATASGQRGCATCSRARNTPPSWPRGWRAWRGRLDRPRLARRSRGRSGGCSRRWLVAGH